MKNMFKQRKVRRKELDGIWEKALDMGLDKIEGEFLVGIETGVFLLYSKYVKRWGKAVYNGSGVNWIDKKATGYFEVVQIFDKDGRWQGILDYDQRMNGWFWRKIKDYIRQVDDDTFLGKVYMKAGWGMRFMGYFYLTRKIEVENDSFEVEG